MLRRLGIFALCFMALASSLASLPGSSLAQEGTPAPAVVPEGDQLFTADGVSAPILATAPLTDPALAGGTLVLARIELAAGSDLPAQLASGPEILYVESGDLTIQDDFGFGTTIPAGTELVLNAGTGYTAANTGTAPVQALRLSISGGSADGTPDAAPVDLTGATTLLSIPIDALPEAGGTIFLAEATFAAGASSGEQAHAGPLGVYIVDGMLKMTSPSGLEGDLEAGRNVVLPASTPLQARTDSGATAIIVGVGEESTGLMSEVVPEPTVGPTPEPTAEPTVEATPAPTAEPTPEPTPGPTPEPALFEAGGDIPFGAWATANGWMLVDNMVVSDGQSCSYVVAPVDLSGVRDYAIEIEAQLVATSGDGASFGMFGRWNGQNRYIAGLGRQYSYSDDARVAISYATQDDELNTNDYYRLFMRDPMSSASHALDGDWHTFRFELRSNELRLYIDGAEVARSTDNRLVTGGDAGFWCHQTQVSISTFKIIPIGDSAQSANVSAAAADSQDTSAASTDSGSPAIQTTGNYSGDISALLPSEADVPAHLVITGGDTRSLQDVAGNYTNPSQTISLFQEWGWQGNVTKAFNMPDGVSQPPGEVEGIYVSIHAFSTPENARAALDWSLQEQMAGTSLYEIPVSPMGDYARALYGPVSYGTEITFLVQKDNLLIRLSASSRDSDPTPGGTLAMNALLTKFG